MARRLTLDFLKTEAASGLILGGAALLAILAAPAALSTALLPGGLLAALEAGVEEVNTHHARVSHIRKFAVVPRSLSIEAGRISSMSRVFTVKLSMKSVPRQYPLA